VGMEHERKFLVTGDAPAGGEPVEMRQAYVALDGDRSVRVRLAGDRATLTVKAGSGASRTEIEMPLDRDTFDELWELGRDRSVEKRRTRVPLDGGLVAELDDFGGRHRGLRLVAVEAPTPSELADLVPPDWFGDEVTDEPWASNAWLSVHDLPEDLGRSSR
jgi:adenylate cyclase